VSLRDCPEVKKIKAIRKEAQRDFIELLTTNNEMPQIEFRQCWHEFRSEFKDIQAKLFTFKE